jgi:aldehyde dehydrogenase (NAD+)
MNTDMINEKQSMTVNSQFKISVEDRLRLLKILKDEINLNEEHIYEALDLDLKKPRFETYATEIGFLLNEIELFIKKLKSWSKPQGIRPALINFPSKDYIIFEPYGKVLVISPWNYPFQLALLPAMSAFAAGNSVVLKPSEHTPNTSRLIKKIVEKVFPKELMSVIEGDSKTASKLLEKKWDYIFFTGSVKVGEIVAMAAAKKLTPYTLELGGKSPAIINSDTDLKLASKRIVWGKFLNSGQTCVAPDYLVVHKSIKGTLIKELINRIEKTFGKQLEKTDDFTAIINEKNFNRLISLINKNKLIYGGKYDQVKRYISPTIIDSPEMNEEIMKDEIFGPILPILSFEKIEDIDEIIIKNPNPLALYVFSKNKKFNEIIINRYPFGGGAVNDTIVHLANSRLPFGGIGSSGIGSYHGKASFELFSHKKSIVRRYTWFDNNLRYAPYKNKLSLVRKIMKYLG